MLLLMCKLQSLATLHTRVCTSLNATLDTTHAGDGETHRQTDRLTDSEIESDYNYLSVESNQNVESKRETVDSNTKLQTCVQRNIKIYWECIQVASGLVHRGFAVCSLVDSVVCFHEFCSSPISNLYRVERSTAIIKRPATTLIFPSPRSLTLFFRVIPFVSNITVTRSIRLIISARRYVPLNANTCFARRRPILAAASVLLFNRVTDPI